MQRLKNNILVVGGKGLVGNKIVRLLQERNPKTAVFIGSRNLDPALPDALQIDVDNPGSFTSIAEKNIQLVVLCANDKSNHILNYCIENGLDYIDITKPTPDLEKALRFTENRKVNSQIVFSSGWMAGLVSSLAFLVEPHKEKIQAVKLFVYYSVNDLAGVSSAHFMAEHVAKPFKGYLENKLIWLKHFLNSEKHHYSFGIGKRQSYNFDTPDLFILHKAEGIPTVQVKMTYNSVFITWLLGAFQNIKLFDVLSLSMRRLIFSANGKGDQTLFDVIVDNGKENRKIAVQDTLGQAHLTAFCTVLHIEAMLKTDQKDGVFFSHQLHQPLEFLNLIRSSEAIKVEM
ncbi:saccharopine dehydrogenase NADP-binding domain-containing protein [Pedobacter sp. PLR]|uniref:saccharopine dehydrogenase NADP-binding domain-containing protein n=1 Tax=Pedobacter sp. PLR TaxID=2994465 RepID=UPI002246F8E2|nr:saccharopine dehydrogenase NADP-binding domain-containing protein [Pedobacter sp. PLR]MCX2453829.1 saccharopine dehydrogenase NADP-binding domain-containing protein [Pedobacter sp. PLR]